MRTNREKKWKVKFKRRKKLFSFVSLAVKFILATYKMWREAQSENDFDDRFKFLNMQFLLLSGLLPSIHSTEDPVSTVHKEPAVHDPAGESQSLPVLSTEEMHSRWHEPRWWVSLKPFFFISNGKIGAQLILRNFSSHWKILDGYK